MDDFEELLKLDQQCFDPGIAYSRAEMRSYMKEAGTFTLVADALDPAMPQPVAGFIMVSLDAKGYGHVITIDIRREFRKQGLGTQLMEAAEQKVAQSNGTMMVLEVAIDNEVALRFYEKLGYKVLRRLPRYYKKNLDGLLLAKALEAN